MYIALKSDALEKQNRQQGPDQVSGEDLYSMEPETFSHHDVLFFSKNALLLYRIILLCYWTYEWATIFYYAGFVEGLKQFEFLTVWGIGLTWLYYFTVVTCRFWDDRISIFLVYFNFTVVCVEFMILIFFWTVQFPGTQDNWGTMDGLSQWRIFAWHLIPWMSLIIDTCWNKSEFGRKHFMWPVIVAGTYEIENMILGLGYDIVPYPELNYKTWQTAVYVGLATLLVIIGIAKVYWGKLHLHKRVAQRNQRNDGLRKVDSSN